MAVTLAEWRKKGQGLKSHREYPVQEACQDGCRWKGDDSGEEHIVNGRPADCLLAVP